MIEHVAFAEQGLAVGRRMSRSLYFASKRLLDLVAVTLSLPFIVPVILLAGLAIRLDSPGPMFFRQERVRSRRRKVDGEWRWDFEPFTFYKLRTMQANADPKLHRDYIEAYIASDEDRMTKLRPESDDPETYKMISDPRVTRFGKVLRKMSIDELPQVWNVLKGDMSLVGPRPPIRYEFEMYDEGQSRRLTAIPGITGWWQVNGRAETSFEEMIRLDLEYIERQSLWLDIRILFMTIPTVVSRKGAG